MRRPILVPMLLLSLMSAGCHDPPARQTLLIAGNAALARYLEPVVKEFQKKNPGLVVVCEPGGSTAAVIAVKRGAIDVAALSKLVGADEDDQYFRDYQVCRDGIAVIVNPANPVADLTMKQLEDIFSGEVTNWDKLGGADAQIHVYVREKSGRTSRSFNEMVLGGDDPFNGAEVITTGTDMATAIGKDANAIGYVSLRRLSKEVKALKVESVEMTRLTMLSGRYPLSRAFYLGTYMKPPKLAEDFVQFTLSKEGQDILANDGMLPVH
jgi:phosphate transport system substrate-binding protein